MGKLSLGKWIGRFLHVPGEGDTGTKKGFCPQDAWLLQE